MSLGHTGDRSFPWKIPISSPVGVLGVQMIYQRHSFQYHDPALSVQCLLIPISGAHFVFLSLVLHTNKKKQRASNFLLLLKSFRFLSLLCFKESSDHRNRMLME